MQGVLAIASGLSPILQIILAVILAVIFWEPIAQRMGWQEKKEEKTPDWAGILIQHFNHDTTDNQTKIESHLQIMHEKQDKVVQLLGEIKEYGIKCRKD